MWNRITRTREEQLTVDKRLAVLGQLLSPLALLRVKHPDLVLVVNHNGYLAERRSSNIFQEDRSLFCLSLRQRSTDMRLHTAWHDDSRVGRAGTLYTLTTHLVRHTEHVSPALECAALRPVREEETPLN